MSDEDYMRLVIEKTREGINQGQAPFGACIVKDGEIVSCEHNNVWKNTDITAHAEVQAIRKACEKLHSIDLSGCVIYSTCEPCPMCYSAIHWARIGKIVYGCSIDDAEESGFNELDIANKKMRELAEDKIEITGGVLEEECRNLFKDFSEGKEKRIY